MVGQWAETEVTDFHPKTLRHAYEFAQRMKSLIMAFVARGIGGSLLASVHKSLRLCDLCKELAFGAQLASAKSCFSYNSFAVSVLYRQFLERAR